MGNVSHFERYKWHRNMDYRREIENGPEDAISPTLQNTIMEITRLYTPGQVIWKVRKPLKLSDGNKLMSAICLQSVCSFHDVAIIAILICRLSSFGGGSHLCAGKNFAMLEISIFVQESLESNFEEVVEMDCTKKRDPQSEHFIDIEDHPNLELSQGGFLWRPSEPIMVTFEK